MGDPAGSSAHALILAATERLARELREDANLRRAREGASVWEAPRIASLSRWLVDTWTASWPDAQLLSATQELVLWREAVERDEAGAQLLAPLSAAREARRADQLIRRYRIDLDRAPAWQEEHQAFRRWRRQVQRRLRENAWLTSADLAGEVEALIRSGSVARPQAIELAGFLEALPPAEQAVLEALAEAGTEIRHREPETSAARVYRRIAADDETQFRFVAQDIRERLRAVADHAQPPPRILIALPDTESRREALEASLRDLLAPWAATGEGALPWRWERGPRLSEQPLIDTLLAVLQIAAENNAPALCSRVLLSSALWTEGQRAQAAAADHALRRAGVPRIRLARLIAELQEPVAARFEALRAILAAAPRRALPSEWAAHFRARLDALGWPGTQALDSQAYQAMRAGRGLLDRLGTLDAQLGRVPMSSAREWLAELARSTVFAPRVEHTQPVLVTSLDEAAALSADVLYVLDVAAARVPALARPTPFLALEAQRAAGIPESAPEHWLARAQRQAARLLQSCAPEVQICLSAVDARGALVQPSALYGLATDWGALELPANLGALESALGDSTRRLLWPDADSVPAVGTDEQAGLRPDSALFKAWFESPFFAFCQYRLGIEVLPEPTQGLDARVQGTLVHAVLEAFWRDCGSSAALAALDEAAVQQRVGALLDAQLPRVLPTAEYGAATVRLERQRAFDVICDWLRHERRRVDAFVVHATEASAAPNVAGLQLRLRLDRVDRVATPYGERWLVIDYKTGREAETKGWRADRLAEPQLPLYASHAATLAAGVPEVNGICFGHLKDGHPALVAQTSWRKKLIEPAVGDFSAEWDERLLQWRSAIESAAQGFLAGEAWIGERVTERSHYAHLLALSSDSVEDEGA